MNPFRDVFPDDDTSNAMNMRYTSFEYIRHGAFSEVFKAYDTRERRFVAIKIVRSDIFAIKNTPTWILKHIIKEAERARKTVFSNVVNLFDVVVGNAAIIFVSEYCSDGDLERILRDPPSYASKDDYLEKFLVQMISGAIEMKRSGLCCRSIGAENILVQCLPGTWPTFKISDLGMTKHLVCMHDWSARAEPIKKPTFDVEHFTNDDDLHSPHPIGNSYMRSLGGIMWRLQNPSKHLPIQIDDSQCQSKTPMSFIINAMMGYSGSTEIPTLYQTMHWLCRERQLTQVPKIWNIFLQEKFRLFGLVLPMQNVTLRQLKDPTSQLASVMKMRAQKDGDTLQSSNLENTTSMLDSLMDHFCKCDISQEYEDSQSDVVTLPNSLPNQTGVKLLVSQSLWVDAIKEL